MFEGTNARLASRITYYIVLGNRAIYSLGCKLRYLYNHDNIVVDD